jgi:DNA-binding CsgD family transcriptional regulator
MGGDVVGVIEAAYSPEPDDTAWVRQIAEVSAPALDRGYGLFAGLYDTTGGRMRLGPTHGVGHGVQGAQVFRGAHEVMDPALLALLYQQGPHCTTGRQRSGLSVEDFKRQPVIREAQARSNGEYLDSIGVVSGDPGGVGCLIMAPMSVSVPVPRRTSELWTRIASHLGASVRLRRATAPEPKADAVLSPSGRVEHAEGEARETEARDALSQGAARIDRARGSMRREQPEEAVGLWRALVAGRWSLIEHFDHDGRRYLLARRNEPSGARLTSLTLVDREVLALAALGHTNKLIAYQLGLTSSAVAMRLSRIATKLGVRTRVQLIEKCVRADGQKRSPGSSAVDVHSAMTKGDRQQKGGSEA